MPWINVSEVRDMINVTIFRIQQFIPSREKNTLRNIKKIIWLVWTVACQINDRIKKGDGKSDSGRLDIWTRPYSEQLQISFRKTEISTVVGREGHVELRLRVSSVCRGLYARECQSQAGWAPAGIRTRIELATWPQPNPKRLLQPLPVGRFGPRDQQPIKWVGHRNS